MFYYIVKANGHTNAFQPAFQGEEHWMAIVPKEFWDNNGHWDDSVREDYAHILDPAFETLKLTHKVALSWADEASLECLIYNEGYKAFTEAGAILMKSAVVTEDELQRRFANLGIPGIPTTPPENDKYDHRGHRKGINWDAETNERKKADLMREMGITPQFQIDMQVTENEIVYASKELLCAAMDSLDIFTYNEAIHDFN